MSKKSDLKAILNKFKKAAELVNEEIKQVKKSNDYTDQGKEKRINELKYRLEDMASELRSESISIMNYSIGEYKNAVNQRTANRLKDSNYQLGLANTLRVLELGSDGMSEEDIQVMINSYSNDNIAISAIKGLLSKNEKLVNISYPVDKAEKNFKLQNQLKSNLDQYINADNEYEGLTGTGMVMDSLLNTVDNMNEDLSFNVEG